MTPSPACGRRWRKAPDEGGAARGISWSLFVFPLGATQITNAAFQILAAAPPLFFTLDPRSGPREVDLHFIQPVAIALSLNSYAFTSRSSWRSKEPPTDANCKFGHQRRLSLTLTSFNSYVWPYPLSDDMAKNNPHLGSSFSDWLDEEGIRAEVTAAAVKSIDALCRSADTKAQDFVCCRTPAADGSRSVCVSCDKLEISVMSLGDRIGCRKF